MSAASPTSPFDQDVTINFPLPGFDGITRDRLTSWRVSNGLIVQLPHAWKAELGFNVGATEDLVTSNGFELGNGSFDAITYGRPAYPGAPVPDPFGALAAFAVAIQAYKVAVSERSERRSAFQDATVRLAGPLLRTDAGTYSLSLLAERRHESVPEAVLTSASGTSSRLPPYALTVSSLYGEVRAPLIPRERGFAPFRGLELALAVRYDKVGSAIPKTGLIGPSDPFAIQYEPHRAATAFTAGFRAFPSSNLLVRANVATGILPPSPQDYLQSSGTPSILLQDPRRGNVPVRTRFTSITGGSPGLRPERARSLGVGIVLNPDGERRVRASLDFIHIEKRDEINRYYEFNYAYFFANEAVLPGRIVRAPLTAADIYGRPGHPVRHIRTQHRPHHGRHLGPCIGLWSRDRCRQHVARPRPGDLATALRAPVRG